MSLSKRRILYAEDDADTRELVSFVLTRSDCEVVATSTMDQALISARSEHFDLYLLDNWLNGASGIELCRELRSFDPQTPILFYSGAAFEADKESALKNGAQSYLTKPIENERLVGEVFRLINGGH
jgi:DNA-binding response OmpR family regulator